MAGSLTNNTMDQRAHNSLTSCSPGRCTTSCQAGLMRPPEAWNSIHAGMKIALPSRWCTWESGCASQQPMRRPGALSPKASVLNPLSKCARAQNSCPAHGE